MQENTGPTNEYKPVNTVGKTIHPRGTIETDMPAQQHPARAFAAHEIYPEATKEIEIHPTSYTADQHFALNQVARDSELANTRVSSRVKILHLIGGLLAVSSIGGILVAISQELSMFSFISFTLYGIQLGLAAYLLLSKSTSGVAVLMKVILVFQIIGTISSIINPLVFMLRLIMLGFVWYAFSRVNTLSRR